jgi:protein-S-isoprenylcysteine O-methyltransferase Ste14
MKYLLIALMWTGYCSLHSYLISIRFTNLMMRLLKNYYAFYRLFYVLISVMLIIPVINITAELDHDIIITYPLPWSIVRYALVIFSLLLFFKAFIFDYDALSFFGIRQILNFRKKEIINTEEGIKKSGLLGIIRHPMYFALIIFLWSQTFRLSDIVTNTVLTVYIIIGTKLEERKLVLEFGDSYVQYQKEVPMLIPFIKLKSR